MGDDSAALTGIAHVAIAEAVYRVTRCGNNRQDVLFADDDRRVHLELLAEESDRYGRPRKKKR